MNILGIETSCDETAASVVTDGVHVRSSIVASSLKDHARYGGIIPEIASRRQMELILPVVQEALNAARMGFDDIDAIAVTRNPGLMGSLLVGLCFARGLARALNKPLIEVDHIRAHVYANMLRFPGAQPSPLPSLPAVGLVVSGGHTSLFKITTGWKFRLLGQTLDDAAGEAFDKVARILDLGYPGGPIIDRLAAEGAGSRIRFPAAVLKGSFDFSFSGVKTAVLYYVQRHRKDRDFAAADVANAFQESVVRTLVDKALLACAHARTKTLMIGGGVAANSALRRRLTEEAAALGIAVHVPPMALCLDNAAMVAGYASVLDAPKPRKRRAAARI